MCGTTSSGPGMYRETEESRRYLDSILKAREQHRWNEMVEVYKALDAERVRKCENEAHVASGK